MGRVLTRENFIMKTIIQGLSFIGSIFGIILTASALEQSTITIKESLVWFAVCLVLGVIACVVDRGEYEE